MQLIYAMSRLAFPDGFDMGEHQEIFDDTFEKIKDKSISEYLGPEIWEATIPGLPNLASERKQDVQDNGNFYKTPFGDFVKN